MISLMENIENYSGNIFVEDNTMSSAELRKIYKTVETVGSCYPHINHQLIRLSRSKQLVVNETEKLSITVLTVYNYYKTVYRIGL